MMNRMFLNALLLLSFGLLVISNGQVKSEELKKKAQAESDKVGVTTMPAEIDSVGFVGIYITESETGKGVKVDDVVTDGPAAKAGIKKDDVILEVNGKKVTNESFLLNEVAKTRPGAKVNFKLKRKDKFLSISLQATVRPKSASAETPEAGGLIGEIERTLRGDRNYLGIKFCNIVPGLDEYFGVEAGVLIIDVVKGGFAEKIGMKPGDVIVQIDDTDITDAGKVKVVMKKKNIGSKISLKLVRHKKTLTIQGIQESE